jgi:hypothetical protein
MTQLWIAMCAYLSAGVSEIPIETWTLYAADVAVITVKSA